MPEKREAVLGQIDPLLRFDRRLLALFVHRRPAAAELHAQHFRILKIGVQRRGCRLVELIAADGDGAGEINLPLLRDDRAVSSRSQCR